MVPSVAIAARNAVVPIAGAVLLLQGIVEIIRCVICLQTGEWPRREEDVEEVDVEKLKEMVHVKDSDLADLDQLVVQKEHRTEHQDVLKVHLTHQEKEDQEEVNNPYSC